MGKASYRWLVRRQRSKFVTQKYVRCGTRVEVYHVLSRYSAKQISRVLCCFIVKMVTLQNTKGYSCKEVDEITSLTIAWENTTNCKTCVGNSYAGTFFS